MKHTLLRLTPLAALLALALVPYGWFARHSDLAGNLLGMLFPTEAAHAVGHSLIFAVVGAALLAAFPALLSRPAHYLGLVLLVAMAQEGFQLLYKGRGVAINDLTDIATDLVAAAVVLLIVRRAVWYNTQETPGRGAPTIAIGDGHAVQPSRRRGQ